MKLTIRSRSFGWCASILLAGCNSIGSQLPPMTNAPAALISDGASNKTSVTLKTAGGQIAIPKFAGFDGLLPYARNNAGHDISLTLINSGATDLAHAPTPHGVVPKLFLTARVDGKANVTFAPDAAKASILSSALVRGDSYALYLFEGKKAIGTIAAGTASDNKLRFSTPLAKIAIAPGSPLVMELATASSPITVKPSSLSFSQAATQTFEVHEIGYTGTLTVTSSNKGVATANPGSVRGSSGMVGVTPVNGGTCTIEVKDVHGQTASVSVSVNGGSIGINSKTLESKNRSN